AIRGPAGPPAADDSSASPAAAAAASDERQTTWAIFMAKSPFSASARSALGSLQQAIELRPDLVLLCAGLMAKCALGLRPQLGGRGLRLMMIEVVVSPAAAGRCVPLRVLDGHVGTVIFAREVTPARRLRTRTVGKLLGLEDPLQFLEEDRAFRKLAGLLVDLVGSWFDVHVVVFGEPLLTVVQAIWSHRRPHGYPRAPVRRQHQIAVLGVLGQITSARRSSIRPLSLSKDHGRNRGEREYRNHEGQLLPHRDPPWWAGPDRRRVRMQDRRTTWTSR